MARLQCRSCGFDREIGWDGRPVCPSCGSTNARVVAASAELSDAEVEMIMQGHIPADDALPAIAIREDDDDA